jgi:hydroxypyruvate reductase
MDPLRDDLMTILRAAIDGVDAGRLVGRALEDADIVSALRQTRSTDVISAGKAAAVMLDAFAAGCGVPVRRMLGVGPPNPPVLPERAEWQDADHPLPSERSVAGARRALEIASTLGPTDLLVLLLSGGGSALMALPAEGITLAEKQQTARTLMQESADIYELNTVRKHLSAIKGGQLAAAAGATVLTLAISDVVGDAMSVIASGPTVADDSTFAQALAFLGRRGGHGAYPDAVVQRLRDGVAGVVPETPKTGDARLTRASARVIGPQRGAIDGAARAAESLGYHVHVVADAVTGEARDSALVHVTRVASAIAATPRPVCVISSGETTVTVRGSGKGGRNQEFAFAMASSLAALGARVAAASIGTDGIDGPTDAAGAVVDRSTFARAAAAGIALPDRYLDNNDTYAFFDTIGDLIRTGPTSTNVGDLQVILVA